MAELVLLILPRSEESVSRKLGQISTLCVILLADLRILLGNEYINATVEFERKNCANTSYDIIFVSARWKYCEGI